MAAGTPRRATGRASSRLPGRVRRALDGSVQSDHIYGESLEVDKDGRLNTRIAKGETGIEVTRQGLRLNPEAVGDKNHPPINFQQELETSGITAAEVATAFNALLAELKRTKRMR